MRPMRCRVEKLLRGGFRDLPGRPAKAPATATPDFRVCAYCIGACARQDWLTSNSCQLSYRTSCALVPPSLARRRPAACMEATPNQGPKTQPRGERTNHEVWCVSHQPPTKTRQSKGRRSASTLTRSLHCLCSPRIPLASLGIGEPCDKWGRQSGEKKE